jgi:hypothetical protein
MADVVTFARKSGGRWAYPVDPDDQEYFGLECADFLPPGVTLANSATGPAGTLDPIVILTEGITALSTVRIQGTQLVGQADRHQRQRRRRARGQLLHLPVLHLDRRTLRPFDVLHQKG